MRVRSISLVFALLFASGYCGAQDVPQAPVIRTSADLVFVPALVKSASSEAEPALKAKDFLLTDNGVPQRVTIEDTERQPVSIVVLMQTGASAPREFAAYAKLGAMMDSLAAKSSREFAMVAFDSRPEEQWDFTPYVEDLQDGFVHPHEGDGKAAVVDAVSYGIDLLRKQPVSRRRLILLISQGRDDGSQAHAEDVAKRLGENNITIECLTFSPEKTWVKDQLTGDRQENKPYTISPDHPQLLHTFNLDKPFRELMNGMREDTSTTVAAMSGGESFTFGNRAELEQQLSMLVNHYASTITLSFRPTSKQPGLHVLKLSIVGRPDLQVAARSSYWVDEQTVR